MWDRNFTASTQLSDGTVVTADYTQQRERRPAHLVLVTDVSGSMEGQPLEAVIHEIGRILACLKPTDSVTIWMFDDTVQKVLHAKVGQVHLGLLGAKLRGADFGLTSLYDAVVDSITDFEAHARGSKMVRFYVLLSDGKDNESSRSAREARAALEDCRVSNFHPILIAAGGENAFNAMLPRNANVICVGSTSDRDLRSAFQQATDYMVSKLTVTATSREGMVVSTTFQARGAPQQVRNDMQMQANALVEAMNTMRLTVGPRKSKKCHFFRRGMCENGDSCRFEHSF